MTLRLGFTLIGDGRWSGGLNYQRTLLQLLDGPLAGRIEACVMVAPEHEALAQRTFGPLLRRPLVVDPRLAGAGTGLRAASALATGRDRALAALVAEQGIDVMFETARFFGTGFPVPLLSWMPDFQHRAGSRPADRAPVQRGRKARLRGVLSPHARTHRRRPVLGPG